jgi:hypothetical protein
MGGLKEYECVQVSHHADVGRTISEWQRRIGVWTRIRLLVNQRGWFITCCLKKASEDCVDEKERAKV